MWRQELAEDKCSPLPFGPYDPFQEEKTRGALTCMVHCRRGNPQRERPPPQGAYVSQHERRPIALEERELPIKMLVVRLLYAGRLSQSPDLLCPKGGRRWEGQD